jgi:hypothetical protein
MPILTRLEQDVFGYVQGRTEYVTSQHKLPTRQELEWNWTHETVVFKGCSVRQLLAALDTLVDLGLVIDHDGFYGVRRLEVL